MIKQQALEALKKQANFIRILQRLRRFGASFTEWRQDTEVLIKHIFTNDEDHIAAFRSIKFGVAPESGFDPSERDPYLNQVYSEGLEHAEALLNSFTKEVQNYFPDVIPQEEINRKAERVRTSMDKKSGRFISVTVEEPEQLKRKLTFFTDVSSASILTQSTALSGVYLPRTEYQTLIEILDKGKKEKVDGLLGEKNFDKGGKPVKFSFEQAEAQIKIFISYASEDEGVVRRIYERLKDEGYDPWLDKEKLVGGQEWDLEIAKAIEESNFFLACLSRNSVNKEGYFQKELKKGMDVLDRQPEGRIYLIPVRIEDCDVPSKIKKWHWVDFFKVEGMESLLKAIETGCEQRACKT